MLWRASRSESSLWLGCYSSRRLFVSISASVHNVHLSFFDSGTWFKQTFYNRAYEGAAHCKSRRETKCQVSHSQHSHIQHVCALWHEMPSIFLHSLKHFSIFENSEISYSEKSAIDIFQQRLNGYKLNLKSASFAQAIDKLPCWNIECCECLRHICNALMNG